MTFLLAKNQRTGARGAIRLAALVLAAALVGCSPADTGLHDDTARHFQELVHEVSDAAAANEHGAALKGLDSLEADVAAAASEGKVSEERRRRIMTSIAAIRADLMEAVDAAASVARAAEEAAAEAAAATAEAAKAEKAMADAEAAEAAQTVTEPVIEAPVAGPVPAPAPGEGKSSEGKGKNKNS